MTWWSVPLVKTYFNADKALGDFGLATFVLSVCCVLISDWVFIYRINKESIVDVEGEIKSAAQKIQSCSQEDVEISVDKVDVT